MPLCRYVVLATPTCRKCRTLRQVFVEERSRGDVKFVDILTNEGQRLLKRYKKVEPGQIVDTSTGKILDMEEIL